MKRLWDILRRAWKDERTEQTLRDTEDILVQVRHINNDFKACFGDVEEDWLREGGKECKVGNK